MKKLWKQGAALFVQYQEAITYLFFGGLATLLNLVLFLGFQAAFGPEFAAGIGNIITNVLCILFAYFTNRTWVFKSRSKGAEARKEFISFINCRIGTAVVDQLIMWLGIVVLGPRIIPLGDVSVLVPVIGCSFSRSYRWLWNMAVKLFSQVVVIVSNYVFSKLFIFRKKS